MNYIQKKSLDDGFNYQVDGVDSLGWAGIIREFNDASIYQTPAFEQPNKKTYKVCHFVLRDREELVAAAQVRLGIIPVIKKGIAYIRWGPLWQRKYREKDVTILRQALRALRNEFVFKRGLILQIYPKLYNDINEGYMDLFVQEGYSSGSSRSADRTLIIDLRRPEDELRKGLDGKWRNHLNQAERKQLEIQEGNKIALYDEFTLIHEHMVRRKRLRTLNIIMRFRDIQENLPEESKMGIFLCRANGELCGGLVGSAIGDTGITIHRAINEIGMKNRAAYWLHWRFLMWLKENQCAFYDMSGINPERNPGTYAYKAGLCGRNGRDVYFLGRFDSFRGLPDYSIFKAIEILRSKFRNR